MRSNLFFQSPKIIICAGLFAAAVTGCAIVDDVGRVQTMNASMSDYNSYAILLNIVRASKNEPLNFVAVTGGAPNTSMAGTLTAPALAFNPYHLATNTIGGNSTSTTASNILAVSAIDDPGSWQAMLTPVDVATIGFFIKQGYPRELLLRLFIDRIRVKGRSGKYIEYANDPSDDTFDDATRVIENLVVFGFTVEIVRGSSKVGDNPTSHICFNEADARFAQSIVKTLQLAPGGAGPRAHSFPTTFDCGVWLQGQSTASSADASKTKGGSSTKTASAKVPMPTVWYDLPPSAGGTQFTTRSAYAVYQYLGRFLELNKDTLFITIADDQRLNGIVKNEAQHCFTSLNYKGDSYCVPDEANNMKRAFGILHQVAGLNIAHISTAPSLAVRAVP